MFEKNESADIFETVDNSNNQLVNPKAAKYADKLHQFYNSQPTKPPAPTEPKTKINQALLAINPQSEISFLKKNRIIFAAILIFLFLAATGVGAYYLFFNQLSPQNLAKQMIQQMVSVKSFSYNGTLAIKSADFDGTAKITGKTDQTNSQNGKSQLLINLSLPGLLGDLNPEIEGRFFKDILFLRLSLDGWQIPGIDLSSLENQWIRLEPAEKKSLTDLTKNKLIAPQQFTAEESVKIKNLLSQTDFFSQLHELKSETINKQKIRHLGFTLDKNTVKNFLVEMGKIMNSPLSVNDQKNLESNLTKSITGEMWIGNDDHYLYRLNLPLDLDISKKSYQIILAVEFNDFNKSLEIIQPIKSKTFSEIMATISSQQSVTTTPNNISQISGLDSDNDGLNDALEQIYHTDELNSDSDSDGYKDGEEVANGYNPMGEGKLDQSKYDQETIKVIKNYQRISDAKQMATILDIEDAANQNTALTGCNLTHSLTNTCKSPGDVSVFYKFNDPSFSKNACIKNTQSSCNYSISRQDGSANPTTNNFQICFYLESSNIISYSGAKQGLNSIVPGGVIKQNCN